MSGYMNRISLVFALLCCFGSAGHTGGVSQPSEPVTRILIVFDASESMSEHWQSDTKYRTAVRVLSSILDTLQDRDHLEIALRVYGPKRASGPDCEASYLMVPFGKDNLSKIRAILQGLNPGGTTPIAYSLEQTGKDFTSCEACRNVVILITDGLEACGGNPCAVSASLQREGIFLRPFIVGIGANLQSQFNCMGNYYDASNEQDYRRALQTIVSTTLAGATAQVSLLGRNGKPTQTNLHVTLYDHVTGRAKYSFIHTLNKEGLPDTLRPDPLVSYDVVVQTIPPLRKENVWIEPGKHTVIEMDASQGSLAFTVEGGEVIPCIIRRSGSGEAIHVQSSDLTENYLAGRYDITVLTRPRMNFNQVEISPDAQTRLRIPQSGLVEFRHEEPITGVIYMAVYGELLWVDNVNQAVSGVQQKLQPGSYRIVYRKTASVRQEDSKEKGFEVTEGSASIVQL